MSAFLGHNRDRIRRELQDFGPFEYTVSVELRPLVTLWDGAMRTKHSSCVDLLENKSFAAVVCSGLLANVSSKRDETLMCRLFDCISRGLQPLTSAMTSLVDSCATGNSARSDGRIAGIA